MFLAKSYYDFRCIEHLGRQMEEPIFNARYFKSATSQAWCSRHWVRLPQMEMTRDRAKPPMKRRTFFEVGSKRWVTTFFRGALSIAWSLSCTIFDVAFSSCFTWLMVHCASQLCDTLHWKQLRLQDRKRTARSCQYYNNP